MRKFIRSTLAFGAVDEASLIEAAKKLGPDLFVADLSLPVSRDVDIVRRLKKAFGKRHVGIIRSGKNE